MQRALLVITKRPQPGHTKTRLTPPLTGEQATQLYECFLRDTLDLARAVPNVSRIILYTPTDESRYFAKLAPDFALLAQNGNDLGERLDNALTHCLNKSFSQVVIINSDGPTLPAAYIVQAFTQLNKGDAVFGPSEDGGYYLVGLTRPQPRLLREVEMSTPTVLQDTLALAKAENVRVSLLPKWHDIDTIGDLHRLIGELQGVTNGMAQHTRKFLSHLEQRPGMSLQRSIFPSEVREA
jgi:rSAM/selenodomain-associated transferase 1